MELHQIRYFLALSRLLNFTRAAEQCNVTQPALTKAVQKLEFELGGELIHRERQLTQLTDLGKLLQPALERMVDALNAARHISREFQRKENAPLRIGLTPCVSATLLVHPLEEISRFVPGLQIEMVEEPCSRLIDLMFDGEVSVAIAGDVGTVPERIDRWNLFEERFFVLTKAGSPLADYEVVPLSAIAEATWLQRSGCAAEHVFWETCFSDKKQPRIAHRGGQESHLQHMAAAGLGAMLTSEHAPHLPSLQARPIEGDPVRRNVELLTVAGRRYSPALDAFIKIARLRDWKGEMDGHRAPSAPMLVPVAGKCEVAARALPSLASAASA